MGNFSTEDIDLQIANQGQILLKNLGRYEKPGEESLTFQTFEKIGNNQTAINTLYEKKIGTSDSTESIIDSPVTTEKRDTFIFLIIENLEKLKNQANLPNQRAPINMKDLIGEAGIKAFAEALTEEYNSQGFRDALFMRSLITSQGNADEDKKTVAWLGGSSGVGKSFYAIPGMEQLLKSDSPTQNEILSLLIDGGVGREISQIRTLVIALSLVLGYSGVSDLHKLTESSEPFRPKDLIEDVANKTQINKIIPETFVGDLHTNEITQYAQDKNIKQEFFLITQDIEADDGLETEANDLQNATVYQGDKRSFADENHKFNISDMVFNGSIGVESKIYQEKNYKLGYIRSLDALHNYCEAEVAAGNNPTVNLIKSDRAVYIADPHHSDSKNGWRRMSDNEKPGFGQEVIITTKRMMAAWQKDHSESFAMFVKDENNIKAFTSPKIVQVKYLNEKNEINIPPKPTRTDFAAAVTTAVIGATSRTPSMQSLPIDNKPNDMTRGIKFGDSADLSKIIVEEYSTNMKKESNNASIHNSPNRFTHG